MSGICSSCISTFDECDCVMPDKLRARLEKVRDELKLAEHERMHGRDADGWMYIFHALRMLEAILEGRDE